MPLQSSSEEYFEGCPALLEAQSVLAEALINNDYNQKQIAEVQKAQDFARKAHKNQLRKSGDPYVIHPIEVATILVDLGCDLPTICAGLLHDVLEDTAVTTVMIEESFGKEVLSIVDGVTKLKKISFVSKRQVQAENFRKLLLAIAADLRVVLVKLADRLHNMSTLEHLAPAKRLEISQETLDVFAPLANRFGLGVVKSRLEDLAFKYLHPEDYLRIEGIVKDNRQAREEYLKEFIASLQKRLTEANLSADVVGRAKHFYSIYNKLQRLQTEQIYDLSAVRVVVDKESQCYEVLGILHDLFTPIPGRFKDFIALPKSNMYQSLHTTLIGPREKLVEVQIRTREMHEIAEFGLAAHWKYKEGGLNALSSQKQHIDYDSKLHLLKKRLIEMKDDLPDAGDYRKAIEIDLFADEIFVFSPKGDLYNLPRGSTPIDFAFYVHTEIGNRCQGAKVNERQVTLDHQLKNGDIVEIHTAKNAHPSSDWLSFVRSSSARSKIKNWFKKNRREQYLQDGLNILTESLSRQQIDEALKKGIFKIIAQKVGLANEEEIFVSLGSGKLNSAQVINRMRAEGFLQAPAKSAAEEEKPFKLKRSTNSGIQSLKSLLHSFAKCCQPLPGEHIVGVISRGKGFVIHRFDCSNLESLDQKRLIEVDWGEKEKASGLFASTLDVECVDRIGISRDVLNKISDLKINILDVRVLTRPTKHTALIRVSVEVPSISTLESLMGSINALTDIIEVKRFVLKAMARKERSA